MRVRLSEDRGAGETPREEVLRKGEGHPPTAGWLCPLPLRSSLSTRGPEALRSALASLSPSSFPSFPSSLLPLALYGQPQSRACLLT